MAESRVEQARNQKIRWFMLLLVSLTMGANYYAYDALSSIKGAVVKNLSFTNAEYGLIVGFYAFPKTFLMMAVIGGVILDRIGIRKTGIIFTMLCFLGVLLTAYGASDYYRAGGLGFTLLGAFLTRYSPELKMMVLGRLLFGMGAETSIVVVNKVIAKWFKARELALAFALNVSLGRIGTAAALGSSPFLIKSDFGWTWAIWVAAIVMGFGFAAFFIHNIYDKRMDPVGEQGGLGADEVFRANDIWELFRNPSFLLISALCVTFYSAVFPFLTYCPDFLHHKFGVSTEAGGVITLLIPMGTIFFTPLFGWMVDRWGKRATAMIYGSILLVAVHLLLGLTPITPYVSMVLLGVAFSLVPAAMWPSVPLVVDEKRLGTAYGLMTSIQNLGLFAFPIIAGKILDVVNAGAITAAKAAGTKPTLDYTATILMFAGLGIVGLVFAFALKRAKSGPRLEQGAQPEPATAE